MFLLDELKRLFPGTLFRPEYSPHRRGNNLRPGFFNPAYTHAEVFCIDDDHAPFRIELLHDEVCELGCQPLLNLRPLRKEFQGPCEGADADDPATFWDIRNMGDPYKGEEMVLTD